MHLVLPLLPMPATFSTTSTPPVQNPLNIAEQRNASTSSTGVVPPHATHSDQGIRYRGPAATPHETQADLMNALRRNIDAIRQRVEEQQRQEFFQEEQASNNPTSTSQPTSASHQTWSSSPFSLASNQHNAQLGSQRLVSPRTSSLFDNAPAPPFANHNHAAFPSVANSDSSLFDGNRLAQSPNPTTSTPDISTQNHATSSSSGPSNTHQPLFAGLGDSQTFLARVRHLQRLRAGIEAAENQLFHGFLPPIDQIIDMRTQLLQLQDEQYRGRILARNGEIESLLTRIFNVYQRTDQLRAMQDRLPSRHTNAPFSVPPLFPDTSNRAFMVRSPDGYQGIITSSGASSMFPTAHSATSPAHQPQPALFGGTGAGHAAQAQPDPNAAVVENIVRQAVLNRQQRANNEQPGLGRYLRRVWLFIRLYFFCYMISDPGTWTRTFLVTLAVIAALFADSDLPQQLHGWLVAPVQRHLEGLVQLGEPVAAQQPDGTAANRGPPNGLAAGFQHHLRRAERSLVLFLASLVPGIGERQVEAQNAAVEAAQNAERARQEEQQQREQAQAATDNQSDAREEEQPTQAHTTTTNQPPAE